MFTLKHINFKLITVAIQQTPPLAKDHSDKVITNLHDMTCFCPQKKLVKSLHPFYSASFWQILLLYQPKWMLYLNATLTRPNICGTSDILVDSWSFKMSLAFTMTWSWSVFSELSEIRALPMLNCFPSKVLSLTPKVSPMVQWTIFADLTCLGFYKLQYTIRMPRILWSLLFPMENIAIKLRVKEFLPCILEFPT